MEQVELKVSEKNLLNSIHMKDIHSKYFARALGLSGIRLILPAPYFSAKYVTIAALSPMVNEPSCSTGIFCLGLTDLNTLVSVSGVLVLIISVL